MSKRKDISKYSLKNWGLNMYINLKTLKVYIYGDHLPKKVALVRNVNVLNDISKAFNVKAA